MSLVILKPVLKTRGEAFGLSYRPGKIEWPRKLTIRVSAPMTSVKPGDVVRVFISWRVDRKLPTYADLILDFYLVIHRPPPRSYEVLKKVKVMRLRCLLRPGMLSGYVPSVLMPIPEVYLPPGIYPASILVEATLVFK